MPRFHIELDARSIDTAHFEIDADTLETAIEMAMEWKVEPTHFTNTPSEGYEPDPDCCHEVKATNPHTLPCGCTTAGDMCETHAEAR